MLGPGTYRRLYLSLYPKSYSHAENATCCQKSNAGHEHTQNASGRKQALLVEETARLV